MAEARAAISTLDTKSTLLTVPVRNKVRVSFNKEGIIIYIPHPNTWWQSLKNRIKRAWRSFRVLVWPFPPYLVFGAVAGFSAYIVSRPKTSWFKSGPIATRLLEIDSRILFTKSLPEQYHVAYIASTVSLASLVCLSTIQKMWCRYILGYQGWLTDPPKGLTVKTKVWGVLMNTFVHGFKLKFTKPTLYHYSRLMPYLPVPTLRETCERLIESVRPVQTDEEHAAFKKKAEDFFFKGDGPKLQLACKIKAFLSTNYVSDWWLTYCYLKWRTSIFINSNYYGLQSHNYVPTTVQSARAANVTWYALKWCESIRNETQPPMLIRDMIPLCMEQYKMQVSTTRIPQRDCDVLRHYSFQESHHVVVCCKGIYYVIVPYQNGNENRLLSPYQLQKQIQWIMEDAKNKIATDPSYDEHVAALTTMNRTEWATARENHFSSGINKASLNQIETAMFIVNLDDNSPPNGPEWSELGKLGIAGNGSNRWCDKSFQIIIYANAICSMHAEHSWGDAPAMAHFWEWCLAGDIQDRHYGPDGNISQERVLKYAVCNDADIEAPRRLQWAFLSEAHTIINKALADAKLAIDNLDLVVTRFNTFGKGKVKKLNISPDAFIQTSLLLAYFRDSNGKLPCTYESSMTRLFQQGRTETIRSCTIEQMNFIKAFEGKDTPLSEKKKLLTKAGNKHKDLTNNAMQGKGVDRHLFSLYVLSIGLGMDCPFLKETLSMPWRLSTSQLPQRQTVGCWLPDEVLQKTVTPNVEDLLSPSGGFGPVADDGYGVSYMVADDNNFFFHVSSKKDKTVNDVLGGERITNSRRFTERIHQAMKDIMNVCEKETKS